MFPCPASVGFTCDRPFHLGNDPRNTLVDPRGHRFDSLGQFVGDGPQRGLEPGRGYVDAGIDLSQSTAEGGFNSGCRPFPALGKTGNKTFFEMPGLSRPVSFFGHTHSSLHGLISVRHSLGSDPSEEQP